MGDVPDEVPLSGGLTNPGAVVRLGGHVVRPATAHSRSIHALLRHVRASGFEGVPEPIGLDADGRERLAFVDGIAPAPPYPTWSQSDGALASIAVLLRRFHDASADFDVAEHRWSGVLADPSPAGDLVLCHNDVELGNVVFRDGVAVALIDFEFAAPGRRAYDLAQFARTCLPIEHDVDRDRMGWEAGDPAARLRLVADAYGLDPTGRRSLFAALVDAMRLVERLAHREWASGDPVAIERLTRIGGLDKYDRRRDWWARHRDACLAAML